MGARGCSGIIVERVIIVGAGGLDIYVVSVSLLTCETQRKRE